MNPRIQGKITGVPVELFKFDPTNPPEIRV